MKSKTLRSKKFTDQWIPRQACILIHEGCGGWQMDDKGRNQVFPAHHKVGGKGLKGSDYEALPMCDKLHKEYDKNGSNKTAFEEKYGVKVETMIINNLIEYVRYLEGK